MREILFFVPGDPQPQPRHRMPHGKAVSIISKKVALWKGRVIDAVRDVMESADRGTLQALQESPLEAVFRFGLPVPVSAQQRAYRPHAQRPDGDNLEKLVLDACQCEAVKAARGAGLFKDDGQVWDMRRQKIWVPANQCGVEILFRVTPPEKCAGLAWDHGPKEPPAWLTG